MPNAYEWIQHQRYLSFTTFRRDGTPVPTALWFAAAGGRLYAYTRADAAKVKRLRNNSRVEVAPCDVRGRLTGPTVTGTAVILPESQSEFVNGLLGRKYKWQKRLIDSRGIFTEKVLKRPVAADACIEITLD